MGLPKLRWTRATAVNLLVLAFLVLTAVPAQAHSISSRVIAYYPSFLDGYIWDFVGEHQITGCFNTGDSTTCAQGFKFNVWAGAQILTGGQWKAIGTVNKAYANYPSRTSVVESYTIYCGPDDVGKTYTFRTRAKGGINHNGTWYFSSWAFSDPRTEKCTTAKYSSPNISSLPTLVETQGVSAANGFWDVTLVSGSA